MRSNPGSARSWKETGLHLLAAALSALTLCLLFVGAMVTSTDSGLAVPDWPTTFGRNMFAYPLDQMTGGIFYEHGHRLFASAVGLVTVLLAIAVLFWEPRRWVKGLALTALGLVCLQGVLGGITVRFKLPIAVSSAHGGLAELFFCSTVWLAWATSAAWKASGPWRLRPQALAAIGLMVLVFVQILVGAVMRHSYAGLAIPTFPKAFGAWIPPFWSPGIALNFAHTRIGPVFIGVGGVALAFGLIRRSHRGARLGGMLLGTLALQIALGVLTVWSGKVPWMASLHLACGALLFGTLMTLALWSGKNLAVPAMVSEGEMKPVRRKPELQSAHFLGSSP